MGQTDGPRVPNTFPVNIQIWITSFWLRNLQRGWPLPCRGHIPTRVPSMPRESRFPMGILLWPFPMARFRALTLTLMQCFEIRQTIQFQVYYYFIFSWWLKFSSLSIQDWHPNISLFISYGNGSASVKSRVSIPRNHPNIDDKYYAGVPMPGLTSLTWLQ